MQQILHIIRHQLRGQVAGAAITQIGPNVAAHGMPLLPVTGFLHGQSFTLQPSVQNVTVMQPRLGRRLLLRVLVPQLLLHLPITAPIKIPKSRTAIFRVTRYTLPLPASIFSSVYVFSSAWHSWLPPCFSSLTAALTAYKNFWTKPINLSECFFLTQFICANNRQILVDISHAAEYNFNWNGIKLHRVKGNTLRKISTDFFKDFTQPHNDKKAGPKGSSQPDGPVLLFQISVFPRLQF